MPRIPGLAFHQSNWSNDQIVLLRELWPTKEGLRRIGVRVGHDRETVKKKAEQLKLGPRPEDAPKRAPRWTGDKDARFKRMWIAGTSLKRMSLEFDGLSFKAIQNHRRRLGLDPRQVEPGSADKRLCVRTYLPPASYKKASSRATVAGMSLSRWIQRTIEGHLG